MGILATNRTLLVEVDNVHPAMPQDPLARIAVPVPQGDGPHRPSQTLGCGLNTHEHRGRIPAPSTYVNNLHKLVTKASARAGTLGACGR